MGCLGAVQGCFVVTCIFIDLGMATARHGSALGPSRLEVHSSIPLAMTTDIKQQDQVDVTSAGFRSLPLFIEAALPATLVVLSRTLAITHPMQQHLQAWYGSSLPFLMAAGHNVGMRKE